MKMAKAPATVPLFKALGDYKSILISVGCFTALINVLMLVPSIYMLQVYDRVLSSQNETTLAMLSLMVVGFFAFIGMLEVIRSFIVIRIGSQLERRFNLRVYQAAFERNLFKGEGNAGQSLGDLTHIRQFVTGPAGVPVRHLPVQRLAGRARHGGRAAADRAGVSQRIHDQEAAGRSRRFLAEVPHGSWACRTRPATPVRSSARSVKPCAYACNRWCLASVPGAKLAYRRLDSLLQAFPPSDDAMALPAPKGQITFEQVSAGPPGQRAATLQMINFN
ncbi:hypothetical protein GCM10009103_33650 [Pseudomonas koreensis]|nr:hypothetical protein GCM10009103_33650 [Pseudomonas koreensis]